MNRHETILRRDDVLLLVIDYQEKFIGVMEHSDSVTFEIKRLTQGMNLLDEPVLITEQYSQGLGHTISEIVEQCRNASVIDKMTFSCCGKEEFWRILQDSKRKQLIITGIETHVCVLQTVLDLLANGYQVHIPIDATCSRSDSNRDNALRRMEKAGAILTNSESVLFELLVEAGTDDFKKVRKLIV